MSDVRAGAAQVIQLPKPGDIWQFSVDVLRRPDGSFAARLTDCRKSLIETGDTDSHSKLHEIANMLEVSIAAMRADAETLRHPGQGQGGLNP